MEYGGTNNKKIKELEKEKNSYPQKLRDQLKYMFNCFGLAVDLVDQLPEIEKDI